MPDSSDNTTAFLFTEKTNALNFEPFPIEFVEVRTSSYHIVEQHGNGCIRVIQFIAHFLVKLMLQKSDLTTAISAWSKSQFLRMHDPRGYSIRSTSLVVFALNWTWWPTKFWTSD